jgi:hypothetical protein
LGVVNISVASVEQSICRKQPQTKTTQINATCMGCYFEILVLFDGVVV